VSEALQWALTAAIVVTLATASSAASTFVVIVPCYEFSGGDTVLPTFTRTSPSSVTTTA